MRNIICRLFGHKLDYAAQTQYDCAITVPCVRCGHLIAYFWIESIEQLYVGVYIEATHINIATKNIEG